MPISVPSELIEFFLLGPEGDRRQLQDSPILGDVWIKFGATPAKRRDLLISPYMTQHAGAAAKAIEDGLGNEDVDANIAYLQGFVVATLSFEELVRVVVPKTKWWIDKWTKEIPPKQAGRRRQKTRAPQGDARPEFKHEVMRKYYAPRGLAKLKDILNNFILLGKAWRKKDDLPQGHAFEFAPLDRFVSLAGLILWAGRQDGQSEQLSRAAHDPVMEVLEAAKSDEIAHLLSELAEKMLADSTWKTKSGEKADPLIWQVSLNRAALPALLKSVPAVKADAATTLFKVNCSEITWAVLDSGVDGDHPAFAKMNGGETRIKRSFDFKNFRLIVSLSNRNERIRKKNVETLLSDNQSLLNPLDKSEAEEILKKLAEDAAERRPPHWEWVEKFVTIKPGTLPSTNHGTHVAGIIGASKNAAERRMGIDQDQTDFGGASDFADGMCPDISIYDFRVLGPDLKQTEFAIIAALQFIRFLNDRDNFFTIHGANLSLSIPHDVRNFACGGTPICSECERLVNSGVIVVAAAGNHGYKSFETKDGAFESYTAFSITDPGNADGVITVGATHRYWPHTYGVSFFSSRGPTGDGRPKPDLVAPGERIRAPFPGGEWGDLDGTSMAAPHVSGAAAMLLARYSELIGQPRRVKRILCETATDLGRERNFQGHGMLDVLRAFQSI